MSRAKPSHFLMFAFLVMLGVPAAVQTVVEIMHHDWPRVLDIFSQPVTSENLRAFENDLQAASVTAATLRSWMQAAQFFGLHEAGEKGLFGQDGWLFYQPGVKFLTQRPSVQDTNPREALSAVIHFRDALAARDIRLILIPAPNKESVYPDKLSRFAAPPVRILSKETRTFVAQCQAAHVEVVDLFALYRAARRKSAAALYLAQDTHWSPTGMSLAVAAVAERISSKGNAPFDRKPAPVRRLGDIVRMLRSPEIEKAIVPESVACWQVVRRDTHAPFTDDPDSDVLVLGDSFMRIYQQDEPWNAGFIAHLALALGHPLASIVNDGGASTLVRQELFRRPQLLAHAKVVVWEFVERDLRLGMEGWQIVPLPPEPAPQHTSSSGS